MEIILGKERRRWSAAEKRTIVAETITAGSVTRVARRHGANPAMVFAWRKKFGASAVEATPRLEALPRFAPVELIAPSPETAPPAPEGVRERPASAAITSIPSALIDVEIGADIRLRINVGADATLAAAVAQALSRR
jgi:transposase-like protein